LPIEFSEDADPYLWLEEMADPRVGEWAKARDDEARRVLAPISRALRPRIAEYYGVPMVLMLEASRRGLLTLSREEGAYKVKLMSGDGSVEELVDSRDLGEDVLIKAIQTERDGSRYAYNYSFAGSDEGFTVLVDADSGEELDRLEGVTGFVTWLDDKEFYYVRSYRKEETPDGVKPPASRVLRREGGEEELAYGRGVPTSHWISLKKSLDGSRALLGVSYGWHRSTVHAGSIENPDSWEKIYGGADFKAVPIGYSSEGYLVRSYDGEGWGRIVSVDEDRETTELVGESGNPLEGAVVTQDEIVAAYLVDASSVIKRFGLDGSELDSIGFDLPGSVDFLSSDGRNCYFRYQSFTVPHRVYRLGAEGLETLASQEIPGDFEVADGWSSSRDGTRVHSFAVKRKGAKTEGALIYGYGGFSIPLTPRYFPYVVPFIADGGVFVQANLRGGTEHGESWHRAGMRERKQNVFDDFASVISDLKAEGVGTVAVGRSNGGLLVGATLTQRPELLDGAVIGYPVIDMRRFHELLIGRAWVPEYGDPDDPGDAEFLSKYSPYHNVSEAAEYPPVLIYTGLHDDRVHPAHGFKFGALLGDSGHDVLMRVETKSGHAGATPITKIEEESDVMAFVYKVLGMHGP